MSGFHELNESWMHDLLRTSAKSKSSPNRAFPKLWGRSITVGTLGSTPNWRISMPSFPLVTQFLGLQSTGFPTPTTVLGFRVECLDFILSLRYGIQSFSSPVVLPDSLWIPSSMRSIFGTESNIHGCSCLSQGSSGAFIARAGLE